MKDKNTAHKTFLAIFLALFLLLVTAVIYHYRPELNLSSIFLSKNEKTSKVNRSVDVSVVSNLGEKYYLKTKLRIPCEDRKQWVKMRKHLHRLKGDLLTNVDPQEMETLVEKRDYNEIRKRILNIINQHTDTPIKEIYFDEFLYFHK